MDPYVQYRTRVKQGLPLSQPAAVTAFAFTVAEAQAFLQWSSSTLGAGAFMCWGAWQLEGLQQLNILPDSRRLCSGTCADVNEAVLD